MEEIVVGGEFRNCKGVGDDVGCVLKRWVVLDGFDEEEVLFYVFLLFFFSLFRRNFWILDILNCVLM